jgi:hypothetical protein
VWFVVQILINLCVQLQVEKPKGFKCGTFGASTLSERHLATGDFEGSLSIWFVNFYVNPNNRKLSSPSFIQE